MSFQREKLLHAIIFFTKKTKACHKVKLFKLLYFLDFEIYRQTGKSTTGLHYFAWKFGPFPAQLQGELRHQPQDMSNVFVAHVAADDPDGDSRLNILPRVSFDESHFTRRELKEMERLAEVFLEATGKQMILATHAAGLPWRQVYEIEMRPQALIPYDLVLDDRPDSVTKEQANEVEREARAVLALFKGWTVFVPSVCVMDHPRHCPPRRRSRCPARDRSAGTSAATGARQAGLRETNLTCP